jgi:hypothetical protein
VIARFLAWHKSLSDHYEVCIFRDRIVLHNTRTGRSLDRRAATRFSSDRMLVADPDAAVALLGSLIREMEQAKRFAMWPTASVCVMEPGYGALAEAEARTIREAIETVGFRKVDIVRG